MRKATLGVIAILIVAGCLSAAASTESAESLESTAADRQEDRTENGELVALWGVEPPRHVEDEQVTVDIYLDEETFDGQTPGWAYAYLGDDKAGIVVVGDTIGVLGEAWYTFEGDESQEAEEEITPIDGWEIDSEEAAEILAGDDRWPEMTASWATSWQLMQHEEGPVWRVEATNVTTHGFGSSISATVSASNGTILSMHEDEHDGFEPEFDDEDPDDAPREGSCSATQSSGTVTPVNDVTAEIELEDEGRIEIEVATRGAGPLDLAVLEDGEEEVWSDARLVTGPGGITAVVRDLPEGDYVVEAATDAGAIDVTIDARGAWTGQGHCEATTSTSQTTRPGPAYPIDAQPATSLAMLDPTMGLASLQGDAWHR